MLRKIILATIISFTAIVGSCAPSKESNSAVTVVGDQAQTEVGTTVPVAAERARKVLTDMDFTIVQYSHSDTTGQLVAYTKSTQRLVVELRRTESRTQITVRSDDDRMSVGVLEAIRKAL